MLHQESRRQFLRSAALAGPLMAAADRPNILFIQTDDQRFDDLSCYGNRTLRTPNIDALARDGVRFLNHFVTTAICCCSRASVLTGQHMRRHGVRDFATPLSAAQIAETYPAILRRNGYRTAFLGKYAIGNPNQATSLPAEQFDYWLGYPQSINFKQTVDGNVRHLTPLMTEKAIEFLDGVPAEQPFCLSLNFKEPHGPFNYFDPDHPNDYATATPAAPATYTRAAFESLPGFLRKSLNGTQSGDWPENPDERFLADVRICYRLVSGVDAAVGKVMDTLRRLKRDSNTVVIFTSDNGSMRGAHGLWGKWIPYEESIRVPLIIRDPRMPAASRGSTRDQMTLNIDLAPTILGLAGLAPAKRMQGRGLAPVLQNAKAAWRDEWYYEHTYETKPPVMPIPPSEAVRTQSWKFARYTKETPVFEQLFDLRNDPAERNNLAASPAHRTTLSKMRARCEALRAAAQ